MRVILKKLITPRECCNVPSSKNNSKELVDILATKKKGSNQITISKSLSNVGENNRDLKDFNKLISILTHQMGLRENWNFYPTYDIKTGNYAIFDHSDYIQYILGRVCKTSAIENKIGSIRSL